MSLQRTTRRHPSRAAATARRLDLRHGEPVLLIDTATEPATLHPVPRARVSDHGAGVAIEGGRLVAMGAALVVRLSFDHWPAALALPDPATYPADRLRIVRGSAFEGEAALAGSPVAKVRQTAGAVVLEVEA